jgi:hypothetical protein
MVRWVIWEKVVVVRHLALSVLAVALVALLAGCGGEEKTKELTAPTQETEILEETTATQAPPRDEEATKAARQNVGDTSTTVSIDPNSSVPPDEQLEFFRLGCQTCLLPGGDKRGHDDGGSPLGTRVRMHRPRGSRNATAGLSLRFSWYHLALAGQPGTVERL